jgi:LmbE family N-acetylglucosaminyl deacetylase
MMKKDDNPKVLFERLIAVQYKYAGNAQAQISDDEMVTQAVQALPTMYNSTVVGVYETEQHTNHVVTLNVLQVAVFNHYAIAMKGKPGPKAKQVENKGKIVWSS